MIRRLISRFLWWILRKCDLGEYKYLNSDYIDWMQEDAENLRKIVCDLRKRIDALESATQQGGGQ